MYAFLIAITGIYLIVASVCDLKSREIPNWIAFSLILFALAYRTFLSIFNQNINFILLGLIGLIVFFILSHLFYYSRVFAGGDTKLLMAMGPVVAFSSNLQESFFIMGVFIFALFVAGGFFGIFYSGFLVLKNKSNRKGFVKEFRKNFKKYKLIVFGCLLLFLISLVYSVYVGQAMVYLFPLILFIFPFLFIYSKAVENSCMIKMIDGKKATVGDWLVEKVVLKNKKIEPDWQGLSEKEVELIRKSGKKIKVKEGIPFVPSFLFAYILVVYLWYSSWGFWEFLWLFSF